MSARRSLHSPVRFRGLLVAFACACLVGCGDAPGEAGDAHDAWPMRVEARGVLGYEAVRIPAGSGAKPFEAIFGSVLQGLDESRPAAVLLLDATTYGGALALLLPATDPAALLRSLYDSPRVERVDASQMRLNAGPGTRLAQISKLIDRLSAPTASPIDVIAGLMDRDEALQLGLVAEASRGHVLLAPSFEGVGAARAFLEEVPGLGEPLPGAQVVSLDLKRIMVVFAERIREAEAQLRGLLTGARAAGLMGALGAGARAGARANGDFALPIPGELIWAIVSLFDRHQLEAIQVAFSKAPYADAFLLGGLGDLASEPAGGVTTVRVALAADAPAGAVVAALRNVPVLAGARLSLAYDPDEMAAALARWLQPVGEVVKGRGAPCDRWLEELRRLVARTGGLLAVVGTDGGGDAFAAISLPPRADIGEELRDWSAWLGPLLAAARVGGDGGGIDLRMASDGRGGVIMGADGEPLAILGSDRGLLWAARPETDEPSAEWLEAIRGAAAARSDAREGPLDAPAALRLELERGALRLSPQGSGFILHVEPAGGR